MIDSTQIQEVVKIGLQIADNSNTTLIPNLPNNITSSLITIAVGLIIRFIEKRILRKKGKLRDAD
jgi:hypothetical protein